MNICQDILDFHDFQAFCHDDVITPPRPRHLNEGSSDAECPHLYTLIIHYESIKLIFREIFDVFEFMLIYAN